MGYTTEFNGQFEFDRELDDFTFSFLNKLANTRRMARNVDSQYGIEGEFYVEGKDGSWGFGQEREENIIDYNRPPSTQPGLWLQWIPTSDKKHLVWNGAEKFYNYVEWIEYLIKKILAPRGYTLNGTVKWQGEDIDDSGKIIIKNNIVEVKND